MLLVAGGVFTSCQRAVKVESAVPVAAEDAETAAVSGAAVTASLPAKVTFNEHIQPILSEYCYHCHGPDSGTRMPKSEPLRLDSAEGAFAVRGNGKPVIVKGDPDGSLFMQLVRSADPEDVMPPPSSHKVMKEEEIALLERWIRDGAEFQAHWAFLKPERPPVPEAGKDWATNPVDHFVAAKLAEQGLQPNPPEDPRRFFRRLHFDLTGLPPAPGAVEDFVKAAAGGYPAAVEAAADQLMATPAAAEHQARLWLDAARYADTHGIHIDNYRAIWPYRDWVIQAFQENMPWDRFTVEQIAGDLLPQPTLDQRVATGFSRCMPTTGEGGAIAEEYEAIYAKDQVDTMSAVWLGLTTGCASCHDHKFDPVSMKDFYSLSAFFRNTTMGAMDGNNAEHPPNVFVPAKDDRARWEAIPGEMEKRKAELAKREGEAKPDFEKWLATATPGAVADLASGLAVHLPLDEADGGIRGQADGRELRLRVVPQRRDGPLGKAVLANSVDVELGDIGAIGRTEQVTYGAWLWVEGRPNGAVIARMDPGKEFRGWDIWMEEGKVASHLIDQWSASALKIVSPEPLKPGEWHHVLFVFDGSKPSDQALRLYLNGVEVKHTTQVAALGPDISTPVPLRLGARHGGVAKLNGVVAIQDFRLYRRALNLAEISSLGGKGGVDRLLSIAAAERTPEQVEAIYRHYVSYVDPVAAGLREALAGLGREQQEIRGRGSVSLVMEERPNSEAAAHILARGVYSAKGERVTADVPASLPPLPEGAPRNRLGLAKWLVDRSNPLSARVTVNRFWLQLFGTGIVETADDFGVMGARPTHPQLLDWLAVEFMDSGWNARHVLKLLVTSATYRQSPAVTPEKLEKDPYNRLLARGPRTRLEAEALRDLALSASGLLSAKVGGPSVKPYQPVGIWEAVAMEQSNTRFYKEDQGEALYRRSLYTFWKRTAPPPSMEILNSPSREVVCVRRDRTNTPLQALVLLNDPQYVEACRQLASNAMKSGTEVAARLDHVTLRLLGRPLDAAERAEVLRSHDEVLAAFAAKPDDAKALLGVGATAADPALPAPELAAWTVTASQILNLDETVTR